MGNQNPPPNLTVLKGGTIVHGVVAIDLAGAGVTLSGDGRTAFVTITGGAQEWQAGTVTDLGANLSLTDGTLAATGGGGGSYAAGLGLSLDNGTFNNTGTIVQPAASTVSGILFEAASGIGSNPGSGLFLYGGDSGNLDGSDGGSVYLRGGRATNPGTPTGINGGNFAAYAGSATITNAAGYGAGGQFFMVAGNASYGTLTGIGAGLLATGGQVNAAATSDLGGSATLYGGGAVKQGGDVVISPGLAATIGSVIFTNLPTADPHVLNAAFLGVSNGVTLSAG